MTESPGSIPLGPPTAAGAGATQKPRDRGRWGPDGGRHGNEGAPTLGTGEGWVHVQVLQARWDTDKPPLLQCDGLGRARALGIGVDSKAGEGGNWGWFWARVCTGVIDLRLTEGSPASPWGLPAPPRKRPSSRVLREPFGPCAPAPITLPRLWIKDHSTCPTLCRHQDGPSR